MRAKLTAKLIHSLKPQDKLYSVRDTEIKGYMLRVSPSGAMTYYLDYRLPGKGRKSYRIGTPGNLTPAQARETANQQAAKVAQGIDIQETKKAAVIEGERASKRQLGAFLNDAYQPWALAHLKMGADTVKRIRRHFPDLLEKPMDQITTWHCDKWRSARLKEGAAASSINRELAALKSVLAKAVEWEIIDRHPLARLKLSKVDHAPKVRYLSSDEEAALRTTLEQREIRIRSERISANEWRRARGYEEWPDLSDLPFADHLKPLVLLSINTGLRRGELLGLKWENVDLAGAYLTVEGAIAKSGKTRHLPLNREALDILTAWRSQSGTDAWVFAGKEGKPLTSVKKAWMALLTQAGIKRFRWHDMRHHFASRLVMAGVDLNTVRELLGHADIKMTLRYAHLAPEHKAEAVARIANV